MAMSDLVCPNHRRGSKIFKEYTSRTGSFSPWSKYGTGARDSDISAGHLVLLEGGLVLEGQTLFFIIYVTSVHPLLPL